VQLSETTSTSFFFGGSDTLTLHPSVQTIRADLIYKFGDRQAVAAAPANWTGANWSGANWSGFYLGGGGGYGAWEDPHGGVVAGPDAPFVNIPASGKGGFFSLIAGYDYQFANGVVAGAYTDYDFAHLSGFINNDVFPTSTPFTEQGAWFAGGRLGYLVMPSTLAFASVGYTEAHFSAGQTIDGFVPIAAVRRTNCRRVASVACLSAAGWRPALVAAGRISLRRLWQQKSARSHQRRRHCRSPCGADLPPRPDL